MEYHSEFDIEYNGKNTEQLKDTIASTFLRDGDEDTIVIDARRICPSASSSSDYRALKNY